MKSEKTSRAWVSSGDVRFRGLSLVRPGGCLVVEGAGLEASVQDADEPVGEFAQGGVVLGAAGALGVVEGAGTGREIWSGPLLACLRAAAGE
jgi:hypothetical protein